MWGLYLLAFVASGLATPSWTLFSESQPRQSELDRAHVAERRVKPEVVVPVDVVAQLRLKLAQRREPPPVDELGLEYLVGGLVHGVVVRASLRRQRALYLEDVQKLVDGGVVELRASIHAEDLYVAQREAQRGERGLHQPGVLALAGRVPDDLAVVQVDQQADVAPPGSHAHIGEVADDVDPGRAPVELPVDDVGDVGLACARAARLELGVGIGADRALALHDADDAAPAEHDAPAGEGCLDLPGPVPSAALLERRRHLLGGRIGRLGRLRPAAHGTAGRSGHAEDLALR